MKSQKSSALVTGASRGIGAAIATQLAQDGFYIFLNFQSQQERAQQVLNKILEQGGAGELLPFDVTQPQEVIRGFETLKSKEIPLEVLVNNAGIAIDSLLIQLKDEDLNRTLEVNLKGAIYCSREATKLMLPNRKGSILQISSIVGEKGNRGQSAYAASKAALIGLGKSLAQELAPRQIRVNVITPGFITTDMIANLTNAQKQAILSKVPLGCLGSPEQVADLAAFLASPKSQYITGQVIGVNGGMNG